MDETTIEETQGGMKYGKGLGFAVLLVFLIFVVLTLVASPMFQVLGFEYSAIASLVLSIVIGFYAAGCTKPDARSEARPEGMWALVRRLILPTILLAAVPFAVGMVSAIVIPNCALVDGIVFYFTVAVPGAAIAMLLGAAAGILGRSTKSRVLIFAAIWLATFALSLLPGYFEPQIFIYGWQYGFFPGFVWDPALELDAGYYISRFEELGFAIIFLQYLSVAQHEGERTRSRWILRSGVLAIVPILFWLNPTLRIWTTHQSLTKYLDAKIDRTYRTRRFELRYRKGALSDEQADHLREDVEWYLHNVRKRLGLNDSAYVSTIYLYSNVEEMNDFVGTRSASISKPWLGEVHLALANIRSLKHELTHILMREVGSLPFDISWSTGITEGVAMAMEARYDGLHTLDEQAARILQMHLATGVRDVMTLSGFASNASQKSYVLAGSFASYLLRTYGAPAYLRLYTSLDFVQEYHRPIEQLEKDWMGSLSVYQTPMNHYDSLRTRYYFCGRSILFQPCLRRIGKLEREAELAYTHRELTKAMDLYSQIAQESRSPSAIAGESGVLVQQGKFRTAEALLDTSNTSDTLQATLGMSYMKSQVAFLAGDTAKAIRFLAETEKYALSSSLTVAAYAQRRLCTLHMNKPTRSDWRAYILSQYTSSKGAGRQKALDSIQANTSLDSLRPFLEYFSALNAIEDGKYSVAQWHLSKAIELVPRNEADSLFVFEAGLLLMKLERKILPTTPPYSIRNAATQELEELKGEVEFLDFRKK